jgi:hypothetical protein
MNKIFLFVLTLALTCALSPFPLRAQTTISNQSLVSDWTVGTGSGANTSALTISGNVNTHGYSITVKAGGTLTIQTGATLLIDPLRSGATASDVITIEGTGTLIVASPTAKVIAAEGLPDATTGQGVTLSGGTVKNYGVADFTKGGRFALSTGSTATINDNIDNPGIILIKSLEKSMGVTAADGLNSFATAYKGGFLKVCEKTGTLEDVAPRIDVSAGTKNAWAAWLQPYFEPGDKLMVGPGAAATLTIPAGVTLKVPEDKPTAEKTELHVVSNENETGGTLNVQGTLENKALVSVDGEHSQLTVENGGKIINYREINSFGAVTLASGSTVNNGEAGKVETGAYGDDTPTNNTAPVFNVEGGLVTAAYGSTVKNYGVITLTAKDSEDEPWVFANYSSGIQSPGMIVANGVAIGPITDHTFTGTDLYSGFLKVVSDGTAYIDVYGGSGITNTWTNWHNQYLTENVGLQVRGGTKKASLTVPADVTLTLSPAAAVQDKHIDGEIIVYGKVEVKEDTYLGAASTAIIYGTGEVNIASAAKLTAEANTTSPSSQAFIRNYGRIEVEGTFANATTDIISDGLIVVSGDGSLGGIEDATTAVLPQKAVVVNITENAHFIDVIGNYTASKVMQDSLEKYIANGAVDKILLNRTGDKLTLTDHALIVPSDRTLTIADTYDKADGKSSGTGTLTGGINSPGLTILDGYFVLANIFGDITGFIR